MFPAVSLKSQLRQSMDEMIQRDHRIPGIPSIKTLSPRPIPKAPPEAPLTNNVAHYGNLS
jgi:hypothetical protein